MKKIFDYMKKLFNDKAIVFEGESSERYKTIRTKWILLTAISSGLPLILTCFISWYNGKLQLFELFGQGEVVLSLFSLTVPLLFDLFEIKNKNKNDIHLTRAFCFCVCLIIFQIVSYTAIRCDSSQYHLVKGCLLSIPFVFASWICCIYSIKVIAKYSGTEKDDETAEV